MTTRRRFLLGTAAVSATGLASSFGLAEASTGPALLRGANAPTHPQVWFRVRSRNSGLYVGSFGGSAGSLVTQDHLFSEPDQQWKLVPIDGGGGAYAIKHMSSGRYLVLNSENRGRLGDDPNATKWLPHSATSVDPGHQYNTFQAVSLNLISHMSVVDGSMENGTEITVSPARPPNVPIIDWTLVPVGNVKIQNVNSGKLLAVLNRSTANGGDVVQWSDIGAPDHVWRFVYAADGYMKIVNQYSGKLLEVRGRSMEDEGDVVQWEDVGATNQHWSLSWLDKGEFRLLARHSNKALTVKWASLEDGANVWQMVDRTADRPALNERWRLLPA